MYPPVEINLLTLNFKIKEIDLSIRKKIIIKLNGNNKKLFNLEC